MNFYKFDLYNRIRNSHNKQIFPIDNNLYKNRIVFPFNHRRLFMYKNDFPEFRGLMKN